MKLDRQARHLQPARDDLAVQGLDQRPPLVARDVTRREVGHLAILDRHQIAAHRPVVRPQRHAHRHHLQRRTSPCSSAPGRSRTGSRSPRRSPARNRSGTFRDRPSTPSRATRSIAGKFARLQAASARQAPRTAHPPHRPESRSRTSFAPSSFVSIQDADASEESRRGFSGSYRILGSLFDTQPHARPRDDLQPVDLRQGGPYVRLARPGAS